MGSTVLACRITPRVAAVVTFSAALGSSRADIQLFSVDPAQSTLTLTASTGTRTWREQSAGGLVAPFSGWLAVSSTGGSIQFIAGSHVVAGRTGAWQPGAGGSTAATDANFGLEATFGAGIATDREVAALRDLQFSISSDPIALTAGTFDASAVTLATSSAPKPVLDYRSNGLLVAGGEKNLSGLTVANAATDGRQSFFLEAQTLILPIDVTLPSITLPAGDTTLRLTGNWVGVRGMILRPVLLQVVTPDAPSQITLVWQTGFTLQTASTLHPPDWTDDTTDGIKVVPIGAGNAFFRVIP